MVGHEVQAFSFRTNYNKMHIAYPVCSISSTDHLSLCCQPELVVLSSVISECVLTHLSCCVISNEKWICFFCVLIVEYRNVQHNSNEPHPIPHKRHIHCSKISVVFFTIFSFRILVRINSLSFEFCHQYRDLFESFWIGCQQSISHQFMQW